MVGDVAQPIISEVNLDSINNEQNDSKTNSQTSKTSSKPLASKTDLPGRVSFSKNGGFDIDFIDLENECTTTRSSENNENCRKKNVRFAQDGYYHEFLKSSVDEKYDAMNPTDVNVDDMKSNAADADEPSVSQSLPVEKYCCSLKCNSLCKENNGNAEIVKPDSIDRSERIIEEYKLEIDNINRRHELELKWSGNVLYNSIDCTAKHTSDAGVNRFPSDHVPRSKTNMIDAKVTPPIIADCPKVGTVKRLSLSSTRTESDESLTKGSSSGTVIENCATRMTKRRNPIKAKVLPSSTNSTRYTKKSTAVTVGRRAKSAQPMDLSTTSNSIPKIKSSNPSNSAELNLNEYQIDKVESWMSTHEKDMKNSNLRSYCKVKLGSTGSLNYKRTWHETPTSKTDDEGNYSIDDQNEYNSFDESAFLDADKKTISTTDIKSMPFDHSPRIFVDKGINTNAKSSSGETKDKVR